MRDPLADYRRKDDMEFAKLIFIVLAIAAVLGLLARAGLTGGI